MTHQPLPWSQRTNKNLRVSSPGGKHQRTIEKEGRQKREEAFPQNLFLVEYARIPPPPAASGAADSPRSLLHAMSIFVLGICLEETLSGERERAAAPPPPVPMHKLLNASEHSVLVAQQRAEKAQKELEALQLAIVEKQVAVDVVSEEDRREMESRDEKEGEGRRANLHGRCALCPSVGVSILTQSHAPAPPGPRTKRRLKRSRRR